MATIQTMAVFWQVYDAVAPEPASAVFGFQMLPASVSSVGVMALVASELRQINVKDYIHEQEADEL